MKNKKKIWNVLITVLFMSVLFVLQSVNFQKPEAAEAKVQAWMAENIGASDLYGFQFDIYTTNKDYLEDDEFFEENTDILSEVPVTANDRYTITVSRSDKTAKIVWEYTDLMYASREKQSYAETFSDRIYYLALADGEVRFYYPKDGVYRTEIYRQPELYALIDSALFSNDLSIYDGEPITNRRRSNLFRTNQTLYSKMKDEAFYAPFLRMLGREESAQELNMYLRLDTSWFKKQSTDTLEINFTDVSSLYALAYEAITAEKYENAFTQKGAGYMQSAQIAYYQYENPPEAFALPMEE